MGGAVELALELGPLEEAVGHPVCLETGPVHELVAVVAPICAGRRACVVHDRLSHVGVALYETRGDECLCPPPPRSRRGRGLALCGDASAERPAGSRRGRMEPSALADPHRLHEATGLDFAQTRQGSREPRAPSILPTVSSSSDLLEESSDRLTQTPSSASPSPRPVHDGPWRPCPAQPGAARVRAGGWRHGGHHSAVTEGRSTCRLATDAPRQPHQPTAAGHRLRGPGHRSMALPMTRMSAPAAMAAAGVAARAWSSLAAPAGRMPGTTCDRPRRRLPGHGQIGRRDTRATASGPPPPTAARARNVSGGASASLVRTVTRRGRSAPSCRRRPPPRPYRRRRRAPWRGRRPCGRWCTAPPRPPITRAAPKTPWWGCRAT